MLNQSHSQIKRSTSILFDVQSSDYGCFFLYDKWIIIIDQVSWFFVLTFIFFCKSTRNWLSLMNEKTHRFLNTVSLLNIQSCTFALQLLFLVDIKILFIVTTLKKSFILFKWINFNILGCFKSLICLWSPW